MKVAEVSREYGLPRTTVSTWKKQSDKIIQDAGKSTPKRKRLRWSPHIEVEQSLILWLREMCSLDVPPSITYYDAAFESRVVSVHLGDSVQFLH